MVTLLGACGGNFSKPEPFTTEFGMGPDKWATAWLLSRHVDPLADIRVLPVGAEIEGARAFDVSNADIRRTASSAAFSSAMEVHDLASPELERLASIIHEIEVDYWGTLRTYEASLVESAYRDLQDSVGEGIVSTNCYLEFFDAAYTALKSQEFQAAFNPPRTCGGDIPSSGRLVTEIELPRLFQALNDGSNVVFVDVREQNEFAEAHIPGADNLTLREVDSNVVERYRDYDLVVPYCVKDFRGYEMARSLQRQGLNNVAILNPYGISGWIEAGLPVAGERGLSEQAALVKLQCLSDPSRNCAARVADL